MQFSTFYRHDEQLWLSFLEGSKESYAQIYEVHFPLLYEYGMRIYKNADIVKDSIQDLFVKLWINRENLKATDAIKPYLYTALRSTVLNKLDQSQRLVEREGRASQMNSFDVHYTIEDSLIRLDEQTVRNKNILNAMNNLTARQKEGIFLRFYIGLEYHEIADIMNISVKASYKIIGRAIAVMRKYFKEITVCSYLLFFILFRI